MLKFLKVLTIIFGIFILVTKTMSVRATGDSAWTLLPMYLIGFWLLSFLFFRGRGPSLLMSGWGVLLGYAYLAIFDVAPHLPPRPSFVLIYFLVLTGAALLGLLLANAASQTAQESSAPHRAERILKIVCFVVGGFFLVLAYIGLGPIVPKVTFAVLGVILIILGILGASSPKRLLVAFSIAFGLSFSYFEGLHRFYEEPGMALIIALLATLASLAGVAGALTAGDLRFVSPAR